MSQILGNLSILVQAPVFNLALLIDGLLIGSVFALAAYGLALVWGVMNVKNLAQGDFVIMGGYIAWIMGQWGIHPLFGDQDLFTSLLATFGIAIVIQQLLNLIFGSDTQTANAGFQSWSLFGGMVTLPQVRLIAFALAALLALGVILFMKNSRMGQAIRATAQDPRAARVLGIDTDRVYAFTFSLNAAICGAAGALISMIWVIQPYFGITHSIRSFVIVTAAGFGNLPGVIAAGLGMGVVEQFGGFIFGAEFQQALVVGLLVLVLILRQMQQARIRQVVR